MVANPEPAPAAKVKAFAVKPRVEVSVPVEPPHRAPETVEIAPVPVAVEKVLPKTVGEVFGEPDKTDWSPSELVKRLIQLPQIDGAIVALQEGLVVCHHLPDGFKGDVFAAFLPQIFARINQYSGEMKLGVIEDLVLNAQGRQCQLFRIGQIYFGVLAKPDETLPWHELRLCADALAAT
jgi:predicted regulator of Ras-like GTPase activity (Roadblock/LC7/MglB family)